MTKKANLCFTLSDSHFGYHRCLYSTLWYAIDKLKKEVIALTQANDYEWENLYMILNGDIVTGTLIYRNQHLESQINENDYIVMFGAFLIHKIIVELEELLSKKIKVFVVAGNHEIGHSPLPHNFSVGISRRLNAYGHNTRYVSRYLILNIANGVSKKNYNIYALHSWGGSDYSSASPSVIRELTRLHSQLSTYEGIIIHRFLLGHTHDLEVNRHVLGVTFDVNGGFMDWEARPSVRHSGLLYYIYSEESGCDVRTIPTLMRQLKEKKEHGLKTKNLKYVANIMEEVIQHEIKLGLLKEPMEEELI